MGDIIFSPVIDKTYEFVPHLDDLFIKYVIQITTFPTSKFKHDCEKTHIVQIFDIPFFAYRCLFDHFVHCRRNLLLSGLLIYTNMSLNCEQSFVGAKFTE